MQVWIESVTFLFSSYFEHMARMEETESQSWPKTRFFSRFIRGCDQWESYAALNVSKKGAPLALGNEIDWIFRQRKLKLADVCDAPRSACGRGAVGKQTPIHITSITSTSHHITDDDHNITSLTSNSLSPSLELAS